MKNLLEGKVCLITGASRGLGRATALEFGRRGAKLVINFWHEFGDMNLII